MKSFCCNCSSSPPLPTLQQYTTHTHTTTTYKTTHQHKRKKRKETRSKIFFHPENKNTRANKKKTFTSLLFSFKNTSIHPDFCFLSHFFHINTTHIPLHTICKKVRRCSNRSSIKILRYLFSLFKVQLCLIYLIYSWNLM